MLILNTDVSSGGVACKNSFHLKSLSIVTRGDYNALEVALYIVKLLLLHTELVTRASTKDKWCNFILHLLHVIEYIHDA